MFELIEVVSGRLIGPKTWDQIVRIFLSPLYAVPWELGAVWASLVMFYAIDDALICMRPEMAVKPGSLSEPMIGDFSEIVTEGFTILDNNVHKINFVN